MGMMCDGCGCSRRAVKFNCSDGQLYLIEEVSSFERESRGLERRTILWLDVMLMAGYYVDGWGLMGHDGDDGGIVLYHFVCGVI